MKKAIAALVAAAFSITVAGTAMAAPAQVNQHNSSIVQVQADKADQGATKKKKASKKKPAKKNTAKKGAKKKQAAAA